MHSLSCAKCIVEILSNVVNVSVEQNKLGYHDNSVQTLFSRVVLLVPAAYFMCTRTKGYASREHCITVFRAYVICGTKKDCAQSVTAISGGLSSFQLLFSFEVVFSICCYSEAERYVSFSTSSSLTSSVLLPESCGCHTASL